MIIANESDLGDAHEKLADFGWFHFAVEDRNRCAWLIVENEHGDLSANNGSDEWPAAEVILRLHGPLKVLQDLSSTRGPLMDRITWTGGL